MTITAIIFMVFILTFVWGGFIFALTLAVKKEKSKLDNDL